MKKYIEIDIRDDFSQCVEELGELAQRFPKSIKTFLDRFSGRLDKLFAMQSETTMGASCTIVLKPSDLLLRLLATLRAGDCDERIRIDDVFHDDSFIS